MSEGTLYVITSAGNMKFIKEQFSVSKYVDVKFLMFNEIPAYIGEMEASGNATLLIAISSTKTREDTVHYFSTREKALKIKVLKPYELSGKTGFISADGFIRPDAVYEVDEPNKYLANLQTHIVDYCNLNCKACDNFSPFCREHVKNDLGEFRRDLEKLHRKFLIGELALLGGEPLLDPELSMKFLKCARDICPETEIHLITNGLLINRMPDAFWECVKENDIVIAVSYYPVLKPMMDDILRTFEERGVKHNVGNMIETFTKRTTLQPTENAEMSSEVCFSGACHMFYHGKIAKCPDVLTIHYMSEELADAIAEDQIDIDEIESVDELMAPAELCKYCSYERVKEIPWEPAGANPSLEDWCLMESRDTWLNRGKEKMPEFLKDYGITENTTIVFWGAGFVFKAQAPGLSEIMGISEVVDAHSTEKTIMGMNVIRPDELPRDSFVIITPGNKDVIEEITGQLKKMFGGGANGMRILAR